MSGKHFCIRNVGGEISASMSLITIGERCSAVGPELSERSLRRFHLIDTYQFAENFVFFWNRTNDKRSLTRWNWSIHISNNHYSRGVTWGGDLVNTESGEETQN